MSKHIYICFILLLSAYWLDAQVTSPDVKFCGVGSHPISEFQHEFTRNKEDYINLRSNNDLLVLPLTIHIVGQNNGNGYYSLPDLMVTLCELNKNFEPLNIQFYIRDNIRYHNNTNWYNHATKQVGNAMAAVTAVNTSINIWITNEAGGAAGYAVLGGNRIFLAKHSIRGVGNTTLTHEMGHALDLRHTFNGWEDRTYTEGTTAPSAIFIGNQSFPVERMDRSINCSTAADGFCDTDADYLSFRWQCNGMAMSPIVLTDPTGEEFRTPGVNFMSYSNDACATVFSEEQRAYMRAHTLSSKNNMLFSGTLPDHDPEGLEVVYPRDGEEAHFENLRFTWRAQPNAGSYRIQVARNASLALIEADEIVTDTFFVLSGSLNTDRNYFWRITPISDTDFCAPPTPVISFRSIVSTSTIDLEGNSFKLYPTLLQNNQSIFLEGRTNRNFDAVIEVLSLDGRILNRQKSFILAGDMKEEVRVENLSAGIYFVRLTTSLGIHTFKIVVQ
jgi:hypothetical protein